jgi:predicted Zn-dependent protease
MAMQLLCLLVTLLWVVDAARADVPIFDRPQPEVFQDGEVRRDGDRRYDRMLSRARAAQALDTDADELARVRRLLRPLIDEAVKLRPELATLSWEIHIADLPNMGASAMAGGKLLVGQSLLAQSGRPLTDGEVTMVLAHEVAHVFAGHHGESLAAAFNAMPRKPFPRVDAVSGSLDADFGLALRMRGLWRMQELEADALGIVLARNAGWPAKDLLAFFDRLIVDERDEGMQLGTTHPSASTRRQYAAVANLLYDSALLGR